MTSIDSTEVQRLRAIEQAALELVRHGPNTGHVYAEFMEYYQRLADAAVEPSRPPYGSDATRSDEHWLVGEPAVHSGVTDCLPDDHPLAWETVMCTRCGTEMLHAANNETMQTWIEADLGNFCLPCAADVYANESEGLGALSVRRG